MGLQVILPPSLDRGVRVRRVPSMKKLLLALLVGTLLGGCGGEEERDVQEAGVEQDLGLDSKLPRRAPDGSSELFKINKKETNTLVYHEKWLVFTKAQYTENPALYRKMWKDRKIQNIRNGSALKGLLEKGATLKWVIYDKFGVHLFAFYLYKEDISVLPLKDSHMPVINRIALERLYDEAYRAGQSSSGARGSSYNRSEAIRGESASASQALLNSDFVTYSPGVLRKHSIDRAVRALRGLFQAR